MPRVHVPHVNGQSVVLPDGEAHHVSRVLRLRAGDALVVFDGRGQEWDAHIVSVAGDRVHVKLVRMRSAIPEPPVRVTLAVGLLKGDQMDSVVRDATALGVTAVAPFVSAHVAVAARAWKARSVDRWERVAVASAKQCGRAVVPSILPLRPFSEVLAESAQTVRLICLEPALKGTATRDLPDRPEDALLLVGPEGGWSSEELVHVQRARSVGVSLGPRRLRAELAPTVALTVLWAQWGWH